jgi:hypothetical protein
VRAVPSTPARTSTACTVWLVKNGDPLTPPAGPPSQKASDSRGATANPTAVAASPDTAAVTTARRSPRSSRNSTNAAGVSLTAAAIPISRPRGQRGCRTRQSAATRAMSSRLTCPNSMVCTTGSSP